jgi:hypothetical protein
MSVVVNLESFHATFGVGLKFAERRTHTNSPPNHAILISHHSSKWFFFDQVEGKVPYYNFTKLHLGKIGRRQGNCRV